MIWKIKILYPDLKPTINKYLKENNLYGKGEVKHQIVYDYFDTFYYENKRGPNSLELYQTFLELSYNFVNGYADRLFDFEDIFKNVSNNIILKN